MSPESDLAITLPQEPLVFAAPALIIVLLFAILVLRNSRARKDTRRAWVSASAELGIELATDGSKFGPVARGRVNDHVVSIAPVRAKGRKQKVKTQYGIKFEAPEAPVFRVIKRTSDVPTVDTGNPKFDAVVAVQTDQPVLFSRFITGPRRAAILRLLTYWPDAEITNREAYLVTAGIEDDHDRLVDSICHLVASGETFDRPTERPAEAPVLQGPAMIAAIEATTAETSADETVADLVPMDAVAENPDGHKITEPIEAPVEPEVETEPVAADETTPVEQQVNGDTDVLTEVRLDERMVLNDLFNAGLEEAEITARFQQVYQGREVTWSGEVLRVGSFDETGRQRLAALIGSADGQDPSSGRVVALTAVGAEPALSEGDVVTFSGALANLNAAQRLFHVG